MSAESAAASPYGEWSETMGQLMSYRYLASRPQLIDGDHAEGWMRFRRDLRSAGGVLASPISIAMLDVAGVNIDRFNILALTQIEIDIIDPAIDVAEMHVLGHVTRTARTQVFTEACFYDAARAQRLLGYGTATWAVIAPTPEGFSYPAPGAQLEDGPDLPNLWEPYGAVRRDDGVFVIDSLSPRVGTTLLHHGPMSVVLEAASLNIAAAAADTDQLRVEHFALRSSSSGGRANEQDGHLSRRTH
jgi:hypothetical protein